eukprot:784786-Prorocentrum_minimum.AAC.2
MKSMKHIFHKLEEEFMLLGLISFMIVALEGPFERSCIMSTASHECDDAFFTYDTMHQTHLFLFVLSATHIIFSGISLLLCMVALSISTQPAGWVNLGLKHNASINRWVLCAERCTTACIVRLQANTRVRLPCAWPSQMKKWRALEAKYHEGRSLDSAPRRQSNIFRDVIHGLTKSHKADQYFRSFVAQFIDR